MSRSDLPLFVSTMQMPCALNAQCFQEFEEITLGQSRSWWWIKFWEKTLGRVTIKFSILSQVSISDVSRSIRVCFSVLNSLNALPVTRQNTKTKETPRFRKMAA